MDLLGLPFLSVVTLLVVAVLAGTAVAWNRWPHAARWPARVLSLFLVMIAGAVLAGVLANRSFGLYSSLGEVFGRPAGAVHVGSFDVRPGSAGLDILTPDWQQLGRASAASNKGIMVSARMAGPRSGIIRTGLLYLPAAYFSSPTGRFPVLEFFHGTPGGPGNYVDHLHIADTIDGEISAGRIPPVVAVFPSMYGGHLGECVDALHGPQDETYLATDVPADLESTLRILPGRSFAALGYSTGGFCAANLGLRHPDRYAAAGSVTGYFTAGTDPAVGDPYGGSEADRRANSPLWQIEHRHPAAPPLFVVAATGDAGSVRDARSLLVVAGRFDRRLPVAGALLQGGGHNWVTWSVAFAPTMDWVGHYLPHDLAPPLALPPLTG